MTAAERLQELSAQYELGADTVASLDALLRALAADEHAPTTVREPGDAVDAHIADSLAALDLEPVRTARVIADLGAGAGFPGLPLAAALPGARVHLVESSARKCAFLHRLAAAAGLEVDVVRARAEEWHAGREACDVVTARALAPLPVLAEYAAPLLVPGGSLVAWKARRDPEEERDGAHAARELGLEPLEVVPVRPFPAARERRLVVYRKVAPTPERFPRRPGMAAKRPLRGP
jgi:16S rRNA (guanine527-N7)-methyltransferase